MKIFFIVTPFLILSSCCAVVRSTAESSGIAKSFEGKLPYQLYSNGDGCVESNFVGTGSILSLKAMDEPNTFCETDVLDPFPPEFPDSMTIYTKIELDCAGGMLAADDAVSVKFWDCSTSDCSECTPVPTVTGTTNVGNFTATRDNLSECFYGWPSVPLDGGPIPVIGYQTFDESMGATAAEDEDFFDVLIEGSCLSGDDDGGDTASGGDAPSKLFGLTLTFATMIVLMSVIP